MSIRILDDLTVNQIAAGEVVERPASVVKELVENALDAGAGQVEITLSGDTIAVKDDGLGMSRTDLKLATQRHATSKIRDADDLFALGSYGFRGEALPSIAAVSELEIRTRRPEDDVGRVLAICGGESGAEETVAMPPGTVVVVRRLFYNTPVRARFLKSNRTELARSIAAVQRLALARPDVSFRCVVDDRLSLHTPGTGDLAEAILALFGLETAKDVRQSRVSDSAGRQVVAMVGGPATVLSSRRRQGVWVNGRPVTVPGILDAAERAYPFGVLPGRRHPLLFLFVQAPPVEIDANVHPAKVEVRLGRPDAVIRLVVGAVRRAAEAREVDPGGAGGDGPRRNDRAGAVTGGVGGRYHPGDGGQAQLLMEGAPTWPAEESLPGSLEGLRPLGQCGGRWIICDGPGGLYVIDQHAAHERVIYERLSRRGDSGVQPLAVAVSVDLSPAEFQTWLEYRSSFAEAGLATEHFGELTVLVREVPLAWASPQGAPDAAPGVGHLLTDLLAELSEEKTLKSSIPAHLQVRRALASCLAAVKSRERLSLEEIGALVSALEACAEPWRCPHGRSTVLLFGHDELARRLGR